LLSLSFDLTNHWKPFRVCAYINPGAKKTKKLLTILTASKGPHRLIVTENLRKTSFKNNKYLKNIPFYGLIYKIHLDYIILIRNYKINSVYLRHLFLAPANKNTDVSSF